MRSALDILTFRKMISPYVLQVLFWAGIGGCLYGTYVLISLDHWAWWTALLFGPLVTRVLFERAIVAFQSYERMNELVRFVREQNEQA